MNLTTTGGADSDNDQPAPCKPASQEQQPTGGFLAYANHGPVKRHYPKSPPGREEAEAPAPAVSYKECLRNHAASIGGHALDGCCEFMPSPTSTPSDPTSLKCAACGCHRNFHRRDPDDPVPINHHPAATSSPSPPPPSGDGAGGRKRVRTKFSEEQKRRMREFSEKMGWKMQRGDEGVVEEFCSELGLGKGVLKVWMHNHKHSYCAKKQQQQLLQRRQASAAEDLRL